MARTYSKDLKELLVVRVSKQDRSEMEAIAKKNSISLNCAVRQALREFINVVQIGQDQQPAQPER